MVGTVLSIIRTVICFLGWNVQITKLITGAARITMRTMITILRGFFILLKYLKLFKYCNLIQIDLLKVLIYFLI